MGSPLGGGLGQVNRSGPIAVDEHVVGDRVSNQPRISPARTVNVVSANSIQDGDRASCTSGVEDIVMDVVLLSWVFKYVAVAVPTQGRDL